MVHTMETAGEGDEDSGTDSFSGCSPVCDNRDHVDNDVKASVPKSLVPNFDAIISYSVSDKEHAISGRNRETPTKKRRGSRDYPGFLHPLPLSTRGPRYTPYSQGRRAILSNQASYPPFRPPLIHSAVRRKIKGRGTMDYVPSPESFYAAEFNKSAFAASPNSLYMYDQERHDMQNTFSGGFFGQTYTTADMPALSATEPDFDLNPQFENSNSLEGFFNGALNSAEVSLALTGSTEGCLEKPGCELLMPGCRPPDLKIGGPTLAELNMDPYLIEDIDSIISNDDEDKPCTVTTASSVSAPVSDAARNKNTVAAPALSRPAITLKTLTSPHSIVFSAGSQPQADISRPQTQTAAFLNSMFTVTRNQNVAVVPPLPIASTASTTTTTTPATIKSEPMDLQDNKSCLHKMLSLPSRKLSVSPTSCQKSSTTTPASSTAASSPERQVMPVVGQTRAPLLGQQVKAESVEEKWKEIEKFIHDPESETASASRKRKRHASGGSAIMSDDEDYKSGRFGNFSDDDSDSDADSDFSDTPLDESLTEMAKKSKQYFWQYNVQAKGPKGTRLKLTIDNDPHHPSEFEDPVFDACSTSLVGIRHGGKARKGDGNEVTPNPRKLFQIGKQLYKLNQQINGFQVSNDQPVSVRNKSRKEKNKLASRACRLKKKAQHEANKVKLTGLDSEQADLLEVIRLIWPKLKERAQQQMKGINPPADVTETLTDRLDAIIKLQCRRIIAGNTTDFVNDVIAKVEDGDPTGGLSFKPKKIKK